MISAFMFLAVASTSPAGCVPVTGTPAEQELAATNAAVRAAFKAGDVEAIVGFHHRDVVKSLAPDRFFSGRDALRADLAQTFATVKLTFGANDREMWTLCGDTAISIVRFSVDYAAKDGSFSGTSYGRAMIVLVRSAEARHGWVTVSEVIQPMPSPAGGSVDATPPDDSGVKAPA